MALYFSVSLFRKRMYYLCGLVFLFLCTSSQAQLVCTNDVNGPNDPAGDGQSDITQLCIDESGLPASFEVKFSWDDNSFSGANTGDACVLFDLDGDAAGDIDYALCASVGGNPGSLVAGPTFYSCSGQPDRCGNSALIGGGASSCSGTTENTDPFSGGDDFPEDTVVNCTVDTGDIPAGWVRTNFCSFPSSQPNSDPKDCIGYLGGGFIEITKRAFPDDAVSAATSFSFSVSGTGTEQGSPVTINETVIVNGNSSNAISVPQGGPYTVAEAAQAGWTTTEAMCDGGTVSGSTVTGITVAASSTTHCEFSNLRSGSITIVKSASPADGTDFSFSGDLGSFTLDVDTSPTLSDNISFDSPAPGIYTVAEAATPPFVLDSIVCEGDDDSGSVVDLGQRQVAIDYDAAEGILCTFTNLTGADVALTKALDTAGPYTVGQTVQYTLVVSNGGPSTATAVTVSDTPTNLTIDTVSSTPLGTCTALPCTLASLADGASETITVLATIDAAGAFDNVAAANAAEADPDPGNNTDDSGNGGTAAAAADPVLGIAKQAGPVVDNFDGTFTTTVTITLENLGNVVLQEVQVSDDLSVVYPLPAMFSVANVTSPLLSANPSFDGVSDTDLLLGTDVLAVGQRTTVAFDLTFDPDVLSGPFANSASGQAVGPGGAPTSDVSDEGNTPDASGDGDPGGIGEDDPTQIGFVAQPQIGVAKAASPTTDNGDGTFTTTITLRVENLGNVILQDLQISDDLSAAFPAPATVVVTSPTSPTLDLDAVFDGLSNPDLLLGTDSLGVGQSATVSFNLTFDPAGLTGPFSNTAVASAMSPAGAPTTDQSDSGSDPDPNADGDPGGPGEDDPTPITFIENPVLGVAKAASPTTDNGDGSFTTTITLTLENLGNVTLNDVQVSDDLGAAFPAPAAVSVANLTSPFLSLNPAYDGVSEIDLLLGSDSLPVASTATVTFDITFNPNGLAGPFSNTALGDATGPAGTPTSDRSDSGTETDGSGDGDPGGPGEDDPTAIIFVENPVVDIAKSSSPTIDNLDGTFTTTITLLVENLGNVVLNDLAITDDLTATFPASVTFGVTNLNSVALTTNPGFDGTSDTDLLAGTDVLPVGGSATLAFDITFNPGALPGPFLNTAIASAVGPGGASTSDRSNSGNDPDPNDDGDPSVPDEDIPTPISYVEQPVLGVAKAASPTTDNGDGTFTTTITVTLANLGNVLLSDVQVIDDLSLAFPAPSTYTVSNLTSATLAANAAFDGAAIPALLAGSDTLAVGQSGSVTFDLTFDPNGLPGPFLNSAQASGAGPGGTVSSDLSDAGSQPDANGNGDPGDPEENDPTVIDFAENPVLGVAKAVGATLDNGNGTFTTTVTIAVQNLGNVVLQNLQAVDDLSATFPAPATFTVDNVLSAALTVNPLFDGAGETNLLAGTDNLAVGVNAQVSFDITFDPQTLPGPFLNSATAAAQSPGGETTSDLSDNGTEADANGNGDPGDPEENDPSPITFAENPVIGAAKTAEPAIDLGGGSFQTTVTLTVENLGNVVLSGVAISDDLDAVIPAPATFSVSAIGSTTLTVNPAFDGSTDIELLSGADNLAVGETAAVSFVLTFQPNGVAGPFDNAAIAQASGPGGGTSADRSDNGTTTDSNGDGNPGGLGEDDPTPISFDAQPVIGAAKDATASIDNGDGTFTTTVTVVIENLGNVVLSNVQISDDLLTTFPPPATFVTGPPASSSLSVNPGFDGAGSINLLSGTDTLAIGETASVSFELTFAPNGSIGPFSNTAIASATDAGGQPTSDRSAAGNDPDPNGDGNPNLPGVEDTPTQIGFTERTVLGIAKEAGPVTDNFDETFTIPLTMYLENLGNVVLTNVQVSDDLRAVFSVPAIIIISDLASPDLSVNPGFDGDTDIDLLLGIDSLSPGMTAQVSFSLTVEPIDQHAPFINLATANAITAAGTPVTDSSTDGNDPDPDGNGDPSEMDPMLLLIPEPEVEIPTLNRLGLLLLILLMSGIGMWRLRF